MKKQRIYRLFAMMLTLAVLLGSISAAAVSAAADEIIERLVERWSSDKLVSLRQTGESYTTEVVGVREPASVARGDWYWLMDIKPTSVKPDGSLIFRSGANLKVVARYNTDSTYTGGNFDFVDATNCGGPSAYVTKERLEDAPIKTDEVFGYSYREVILDMGALATDIPQMNIHIGTPSLFGRHTVEMYGLSIYVDDVLVWDCEGEALSNTRKGEITRENILNSTGGFPG